MMPAYHQATQLKTKYTTNYAKYDSHRLQACTERITNMVHQNIVDIQKKYLEKQICRTKIVRELEMFQDLQTSVHHLTALTIFGIKKQTKSPNKTYSWNNTIKVQEILNDTEIDSEHRTQKLTQLIQQNHKQQQEKKKKQQLTEQVLRMFKKHNTQKRQHKTKCHHNLKAEERKILSLEQRYAHYSSHTLMKPIRESPPATNKNDEITSDATAQTMTTDEIEWVLHEMKKNRSPGMTAFPVSCYYWGAKPMHDMLYRWYQQLRQNRHIPWNLKLDIKVPFPKHEPDADKTIKHNSSKNRPIPLQNSMYKILDGCTKNSLERHDMQHQIMHYNQGGFKQKEGTIENLYTLQNIFQYNQHICCAFLDLEKADDSVWRDALLKKLRTTRKMPTDLLN